MSISVRRNGSPLESPAAGGMYDAIRYGTAVYRNELAKRVQQIGYRITPAKHGFEVEGVSDEVLNRFSKRSQETKKVVQEMEQKLGRKLSNSEVAYAVHRTRARKLKGISTVEVRERQQAQLSAHELGSLRILEQHSVLESGQLTRIRRQRRAEYRHAVEFAAQKRTAESFAQLERMGAVTELGSDELHSVAAQAYLEASKKGQTALLVAPTWAEIEAVTERIRATLKSSGGLLGEEREFQVFDSLSWTEAQKRDARQYRPGMALRFHRSKAGFARGESVEVVTVGADTLGVRRRDGSTVELKLGRGPASFDAGEIRTLGVAAGDKLLLQANTDRKRFINGELVEVNAVHCGDILLNDGRVIPEHYRTFTHGYAVTSHAAQGKTVDEVLVVASSRSFPAVHLQQFYVSISRGRERCQVFTDDKDLLRSHVTDSSERLAAVEVVPHVSETFPPAHGAIPFVPRRHRANSRIIL